MLSIKYTNLTSVSRFVESADSKLNISPKLILYLKNKKQKSVKRKEKTLITIFTSA
jgi:hypothetical protein